MSKDKEIHKHYHIHLWPNIDGFGWLCLSIAAIVISIAFNA